MTLHARDSDGWLVPRVGTKSRIIYGLLKHGLSTLEIADETGWDRRLVRVLAHKIRRPKLPPEKVLQVLETMVSHGIDGRPRQGRDAVS